MDIGMQLVVKQINIFNIWYVLKITRILTECGVDMSKKYGLNHWKHSFAKTLLIVYYTALKNHVYGVFENKNMVATFQICKKNASLHFSKFAVSPSYSGKGIGGYCLRQIEFIARKSNLEKLTCEVYDKSNHAFEFYDKCGFKKVGEISTRKNKEIVLEKQLR